MIFYTEKSTSLLWEVKFFSDFVMVKMATPGCENTLIRMSLADFDDRFEEFWGDPDQVFAYLGGEVSPVQIN
jgi:hypothetical protein